MPGGSREKPSVFFSLTQEHLDDIRRGSKPAGVDRTREELSALSSSEAIQNGMLWMEQRDTILGFEGPTRREKFRELHKNDGTGTTTEPKPEAG